MATRILLADDHALVLAGLRRIMVDEVDFTVVAEAVDGAQAVQCAQRHDFDQEFLFEALRVGAAAGYVLRSSAESDLVSACRTAWRGEPFLYPKAVGALVRDYAVRRGLVEPWRSARWQSSSNRCPPRVGRPA
jgi:DNA-binding NarL/FixJ family response regulator